jgi:class 3 adenylate cyclase/predicted ATPase
MRCPSCHSENPENARFCIGCGAAFARRCVKCGFENLPQAKFCGRCGAELTEPAASQTSGSSTANVGADAVAPGGRGGHEGERRHLTVLFCDLAGSTGIATRLDPEQWRETVSGYHRAVAEAIIRFDGHVAKYLGDGVMAYFGWPAAHDNDAERAARSGLAILDALAKLNQQPGHANLSARVGIDSGTVVIGKGAGNEAEVFGDVPNIAARVQAVAGAGTVVITDTTHRLVRGLFIDEDCGAHQLKGIERPIHIYRVIRPSGMRGRFDVTAAAGGLTPFVGRDEELRSLMNRWERALEGEGQVVLIIGEAGIGKSRLVRRFREQIAGTPHTWVEAGADAFYQNTPFYPVGEMLRQMLAGSGGNSEPEYQLAQLTPRLELAGIKAAEAIPLIAPLLNLRLPPEYPPSALAPDQQRRRLLATLVEWVLGSARVQPLMIVTEDLHWADPSTLELIQLLVEQGATARLLLSYTARPEFRAPWPIRAHHTQINLNRLSVRDIRTMIVQVAASEPLADDTVAAVVERTGGVPLFVEELTRAVLESGETILTGREIPATLHDSLMARLDRLGAAKEAVQVGAVIGSEFSYGLLHAVHPIAEGELQAALRKLTDAELLYVRGIAPDATYQFKHALIRDAAYEALLKTRRRELHREVAQTLTAKFGEIVEAHPEVLARHYAEAGLIEQAIPYWQKAGQRALERSAFVEAIAQLTTGLKLLPALIETRERAERELRLQTALGTALTATKGPAAPETEHAYTRARALCQQVGETARLFPVLGGLCAFYQQRGEYRTARELAEQLLGLAQSNQDPIRFLWAHFAVGASLDYLGELVPARRHLEKSLGLYAQHQPSAYYGTQDPGVVVLCQLAHLLFRLGYPDQALKRSQQALTLAQELTHSLSVAMALGYLAGTHLLRGEWQLTQEHAAATVTFAAEQGFPHFLALGTVHSGWALAEGGQRVEGITQMRQGMAALAGAGAAAKRSWITVLLAEEYREEGSLEEGLTLLAEALAEAEKTGDLNYEAELYRLKGELTRQNFEGSPRQTEHPHSVCRALHSEAEECFRKAIEIARRQEAKSWELRATMSFARLLEEQGRRDEARTMLADIYNWFTEGFDTADLKDAKTLLDELSK